MRNPATARTLMVQGTASSSGKSLLTAAICRILHQDGCRVAPFKAQNMSNNSFVTGDGLEMGRAQVVQALAAGLEPDVRMNPVLLKPTSDRGSQVVLRGRAAFTMDARVWHETRERLRGTILECFNSLAADYEAIVIEGAGSPAEINLKHNDIVNMGMAEMADAPVVIVGDIDRGGVFAALAGTMQLLDPDERRRVKGFVINKFRGDRGLLEPGLRKLEEITGVPVLGVVPWIEHCIDEEDGVSERFVAQTHGSSAEIDVGIVHLPHISNYTDFIPLESVPGVSVRWCRTADSLGNPDLIILPGTKSTIADLKALKARGIARAVVEHAGKGAMVLGVCGGFQILGREVRDRGRAESSSTREPGLGLLDMSTDFHTEKRTSRVTFEITEGGAGRFAELAGTRGAGYEIHMGVSRYGEGVEPFTLSVDEGESRTVNGVVDAAGRIMGTYVHGFFDTAGVALGFINMLRKRKSLPPLDVSLHGRQAVHNAEINRLAHTVRENLAMDKIYDIAGLHHVGA